jgi:hypothetical protein
MHMHACTCTHAHAEAHAQDMHLHMHMRMDMLRVFWPASRGPALNPALYNSNTLDAISVEKPERGTWYERGTS